jgi:hypothetical protein
MEPSEASLARPAVAPTLLWRRLIKAGQAVCMVAILGLGLAWGSIPGLIFWPIFFTFLGLIMIEVRLRCPHCGESLSPIATGSFVPRSRVRHGCCVGCGQDLSVKWPGI